MDSKGFVIPVTKWTREPGISFVIRARNEEEHLPKALDSLKKLVVPYEIILILHRCTDKSKEIAEQRIVEGMPIQIQEWNHPISRAGFENLATPGKHPYSLQTFYNKAFTLSNKIWIFKWDADFEATPELIQFINYKLDIENQNNHIRYRIPCILGNKVNYEYYLSNCLLLYNKNTFWESPVWNADTKSCDISEQIISVPVDTIKSYWDEPPWFLNGSDQDIEIAKKWKFLNLIFGKEIKAGARASCREMTSIEYEIYVQENYLSTHGIYLTS
jgi:glycosyltransferase involved in cell wall biosynthesis